MATYPLHAHEPGLALPRPDSNHRFFFQLSLLSRPLETGQRLSRELHGAPKPPQHRNHSRDYKLDRVVSLKDYHLSSCDSAVE